MDVIKTMTPGVPGTKRFYRKWGDRLIAVRYRNDLDNNRRITTVEICVDQRPLSSEKKQVLPSYYEDAVPVPVRVGVEESELRELIKQHGGKWDVIDKAWYLSLEMAKILGLTDRVVAEESLHLHAELTD